MTLWIIHVCEPTNTLYSDEFYPILINPVTCRIQRIVIGNTEFSVSTMNTCPHPNFIISDKRKNFLIGSSIDVANNQELLLVFHQLSNKFTEKGERRVSDDNIRFFQNFYALLTSEITVTF